MLNWPDWNKLYANWQCLYFWVPFSDEQWEAINKAANTADKNELIRKFREEYLANRDIVTWELKKPVEEEKAQEPKGRRGNRGIYWRRKTCKTYKKER